MLAPINYLREFVGDFYYTARYGTNSPVEQQDRRLYYKMLIVAHAIEKGLSLPMPRVLFGREKLRKLIHMASNYNQNFSVFPLEVSSGAMKAYLEFHRNANIDDPFLDEMDGILRTHPAFANIELCGKLRADVRLPPEAGVPAPEEAINVLESRFSCRSYNADKVPASTIRDIVKFAQFAPSQCNRQSVKIHCYQSPKTIEKLLVLQSGAKGMAHVIHNVFIVTFEATAWAGLGQRNQGYTDGGIFAQQLMLACQIHGVSTCALNLGMSNSVERTMKRCARIHERERLVVMLAFGYADPDHLYVARSPRRPVREVLVIHADEAQTTTKEQTHEKKISSSA